MSCRRRTRKRRARPRCAIKDKKKQQQKKNKGNLFLIFSGNVRGSSATVILPRRRHVRSWITIPRVSDTSRPQLLSITRGDKVRRVHGIHKHTHIYNIYIIYYIYIIYIAGVAGFGRCASLHPRFPSSPEGCLVLNCSALGYVMLCHVMSAAWCVCMRICVCVCACVFKRIEFGLVRLGMVCCTRALLRVCQDHGSMCMRSNQNPKSGDLLSIILFLGISELQRHDT